MRTATLRRTISKAAKAAAEEVAAATRKVREGKIATSRWDALMRANLRELLSLAAVSANGGSGTLDATQRGFLNQKLNEQIQYFRRFLDEVKDNPEAASAGRAAMYMRSALGVFEDLRRQHMQKLGYRYERSILSAGEHCAECVTIANEGWKPIGTIKLPGSRSCLTNCGCYMSYSRAAAFSEEFESKHPRDPKGKFTLSSLTAAIPHSGKPGDDGWYFVDRSIDDQVFRAYGPFVNEKDAMVAKLLIQPHTGAGEKKLGLEPYFNGDMKYMMSNGWAESGYKGIKVKGIDAAFLSKARKAWKEAGGVVDHSLLETLAEFDKVGFSQWKEDQHPRNEYGEFAVKDDDLNSAVAVVDDSQEGKVETTLIDGIKSTFNQEHIDFMFGDGNVSAHELSLACGALRGADVDFEFDKNENWLNVSIRHPEYTANRIFVKGLDTLVNERFRAKVQKSGIGTRVLHQQVVNAAALGFARIATTAVGTYGDPYSNGYYTWARLGYDCRFSDSAWLEDIRSKLPESLQGASRISDLMKTPEGRDWWLKNGNTFSGEFDLAPGSLSRRVLDGYARAKGIETTEPDRRASLFKPKGRGNSGSGLGSGEQVAAFAKFNPSDHPRAPKGNEHGGEFTKKGVNSIIVDIDDFLKNREKWDHAKLESLIESIASLSTGDLDEIGEHIEAPYKGSKANKVAGLSQWLRNIKQSSDQTQFTLRGESSPLESIYESFRDLAYDDIEQQVRDILEPLSADAVKKAVNDFGISQTPSKREAIEAAVRKIHERKESWERTEGIGKPVEKEAAQPKRENRIHVKDDPKTYGQKQYHLSSPSGAPVRGVPISPKDPRIPEIVYHATTNLPAVQSSGYLRAGGEGGLGGDRRDQIVSMTTSKEIAEQIAEDMRFTAELVQKHGKAPPTKWNDEAEKWEYGDRPAWGAELVADLQEAAEKDGFKYSPIDLQISSYGLGDHLRQFFSLRQQKTKKLDPLVYDAEESFAKIKPSDIGIVEIPKKNLATGAMLTDFDLDNPFGLKEIRSYGDVPLGEASFDCGPLQLHDIPDPAEPTEAQKKAGNFKKTHIEVQGLQITIEAARGQYRRGVSKNGKPWRNLMTHHYGYIKRTESEADGDHIDVFVGYHPDAKYVYIVDQLKEDGGFDEHKCMIGFRSIREAKEGYYSNYRLDWRGLGGITQMPMELFKHWIKNGDTSKPLGELTVGFAFEESKHPRDNAGKFATSPGSGYGNLAASIFSTGSLARRIRVTAKLILRARRREGGISRAAVKAVVNRYNRVRETHGPKTAAAMLATYLGTYAFMASNPWLFAVPLPIPSAAALAVAKASQKVGKLIDQLTDPIKGTAGFSHDPEFEHEVLECVYALHAVLVPGDERADLNSSLVAEILDAVLEGREPEKSKFLENDLPSP